MNARQSRWGSLRRVFRLPPSRAQIDVELANEFGFHIEERIEQFMESGMSRQAAELEVTRRFGDYDTHWQRTRRIDEESMRQRHRLEFLNSLLNETRHSARVLLHTPGFSLIAFLTLALGIGATTAIYTVLDTVVLRPLPYQNAKELVSLLHPSTVPGSGERKWGLSAGGYFHFRNNNRTLRDMGMFRTFDVTVTNSERAEVARVGLVTPSVFAVLGARAEHGRLFNENDGRPGQPVVVVLSREFVERRFGGETSVIGRNLETSNGSFEIVGIAESGLTLPMPGPFASQSNLAGFGVDVWWALQLNPEGPFHNNHPFVGVARLKPGVTVETAQLDISALASRFSDVLPGVYSKGFLKAYNFRTEVSELRNAVLGEKIPRALWMVFGSVILVLLIAAANVANLFIVRMEARRRESAIRTALGANGVHMAAHFLSESLLLSGLAGLAGVLLAHGGLRALLAIAPTDIPRLSAVTMSWSSVGVSMTLALMLGAILGCMPLSRRPDINALRDGARGASSSPRQRAVRSGLVIGQVAFALMLVTAAGLMLRSFSRLREVQPGFAVDNALAFNVSLPYTEYDTREKALVFHRELQRQIAGLGGVVAVGATSSMPLEDYGTGCSVVFREGQPYGRDEKTPCVSTPIAAPGFFEALGITVQGRVPTWVDVDARTQAVVVTRALADHLWPNQDPIGKGIGSNGWDSNVWYRVVGVVPEIRAEALDHAPTEAVFYAATSLQENSRDESLNDLTYIVRTSGMAPVSLTRPLNGLVSSLNSRVPLVNPRSITQVVERSMARTTFIMLLLGVAAGVALLLSAVGMYGVISYVVAQRRAEIGIRIALGASVVGVARLIVLQSVRLALAGVVIGGLGAYAAGQGLSTLLFEVSPSDPVVMIGMALLLVVIAAGASVVPARRAAKTDPVSAIRWG